MEPETSVPPPMYSSLSPTGRERENQNHRHLSEFSVTYQRSNETQPQKIIFLGSVSESLEEQSRGKRCLRECFCSWESLTLLTWLLIAGFLFALWSKYHSSWGLGVADNVRCEPLPLWTLVTAIIMLALAVISISIMSCEYTMLGGEIYSIWLIGSGTCLLAVGLCVACVWVALEGWRWMLNSQDQCGPGLREGVLLALPLLTVVLCSGFIFRVLCALDKSGDERNCCCYRWRRSEWASSSFFCCCFDMGGSKEERMPLFGMSKDDEKVRTTRGYDEQNVGPQSILTKDLTPMETYSSDNIEANILIDEKWNAIQENRRRNRGWGGEDGKNNEQPETIGFVEFTDHFSMYFDELGSLMPDRLFKSLSVDGNLTKKNLLNGLVRWSKGSMRDQLTVVFDMWDLNRNGRLEKEELRDMMKQLSNSSGTDFLSEALHLSLTVSDTDKDEELDALVNRFESSLNINEIDDIELEEWLQFAEGDKDIHDFLERFTVRSY